MLWMDGGLGLGDALVAVARAGDVPSLVLTLAQPTGMARRRMHRGQGHVARVRYLRARQKDQR